MSIGNWRHHHDILSEYAQSYPHLSIFVETGTWFHETTAHMAKIMDTVITIDTDHNLTIAAISDLCINKNQKNAFPICGDSAILVPKILEFNKPIFFFLDAHQSDDEPLRRGNSEMPIWQELDAIVNDVKLHLILIDDARMFAPEHPGYPNI